MIGEQMVTDSGFLLPGEEKTEEVGTKIRETFLYMTMRSLMLFLAEDMGVPRQEAIRDLEDQDKIWQSLGGTVVEGWDDA